MHTSKGYNSFVLINSFKRNSFIVLNFIIDKVGYLPTYNYNFYQSNIAIQLL